MAVFFRRRGAEEYLSYYSKFKAVSLYRAFRNNADNLLMFLLIPSFFVSPLLFFVFFFVIFGEFFSSIYWEFLSDERKIHRYKNVFMPKSSMETVGIVGYQVFEEELEEHLGIVKRDDDEAKSILKEKQKRMSSRINRWRHVGLDFKLLTTHLMIPGKTGAGKTELVRSISEDAALKTGGGLLMNDGKSDTKLMREFVSQAIRIGRGTSVRVINYLKLENAAESHTFSFLTMMHPVKAVEFMGELIGGGGGEGNAQYFFQQGKTLFFPIVNATYIRHQLYSEGYTLEKIFENMKLHNMILLNVIFYGMSREISDRINTTSRLKSSVLAVNSMAADENLRHVAALIEYIVENPTAKPMVKEEIGIDYEQVREIFINSYTLLNSYLVKIWNQFDPLLDVVSRVVYHIEHSRGLTFLGDDGLRIRDVKALVQTLRVMTTPAQDKPGSELEKLEGEFGLLASGEFVLPDLVRLRDAFHRSLGQGGNIDTPPADAVQQLAYGQQQWNPLVNIAAMFPHVLGQTHPEVDPVKLITNNQFCYVLLPPLELNKGLVEVLGRIQVNTIKEVAGVALLGERLSLHPTIERIHRDRYTPKPFTFVILDEYGAYPVPSLSLLLAQCRSLNMSVAVAIQDLASLKEGGVDVTSQERALGNTTKIIAKSEDRATVEWVQAMMSETLVETPKLQKDAKGDWAATADTDISKMKTFNAERIRDFGNGFALLMMGSTEEDLVFVQSFYRGGEGSGYNLTRFEYLEMK